jgi:branched-chain amino acid transport system permease protein
MLWFLAFVLNKTSFGRQIRATAQQPLAAEVCGVNVSHVYAMTFGLGAAFAGAAGIVIGIVMPFSPHSEGIWTLNAFVVVVLGGVGSPAGALAGGILLGLIKTLTAQFIGPAYERHDVSGPRLDADCEASRPVGQCLRRIAMSPPP